MTNNFKLLKITLLVFGVMALIYGVLILVVPRLFVNIPGSEFTAPPVWLRWSGGILIAFGVASFLAIKDIMKHVTLIFVLALDSLLCGLAFFYGLFIEVVIKVWFTIIPTALILILSVLFGIGWRKIARLQKER